MAYNDRDMRSEPASASGKKPWVSPEIHDQSVHSLTEAKPVLNPTEAAPTVGS